MALFSYISMKATGDKVLYCPFCEEKMLYSTDTHVYRCPICNCEIIEEERTVPYAAMVDFF